MSLLDLTVEELRGAGITHLVSTANLESFALYETFAKDPDLTVVDTCREGEAVAIASGLSLTGKKVCLSMENFGLFESLDTIRALPRDMGIGIPIFIGYTGRGAVAEAIEPFTGNMKSQVQLAGDWTEPILDVAGIGYELLSEEASDEDTRAALRRALAAESPYGLLVDLF
jgi:sulfopyruvate decarboxylase TPP-binding subunit